MKINGQFETMQEAFDFCRECDRPIIVNIEGRTYRLFPSGAGQELTDQIAKTFAPKAKTA